MSTEDLYVTPELARACAVSDMLLMTAGMGEHHPSPLELIFPGTGLEKASEREIKLAEAVVGRVLPRRSPNAWGSDMPVNVAYLRAALTRWAAQNTPLQSWETVPAAE